ncbi:MAG TPA: hypothetical protein VNJ03_01295, partial [Vicinamibacterales bacterium]|nr:hypothetical protein [Vicinamibacterales bacterium]
MTNRRGRMSLCLPLVALLAFGGACSSPTAPPAPTAIAIAPAPGVLKIGQNETLRAVASPEVSGALTVTWTSDNPA